MAGVGVGVSVARPFDPALVKGKLIGSAGRFEVGSLLGCGSSGAVYELSDKKTGAEGLAVKIDIRGKELSTLKREYLAYKELKEIPGIPKILHLGELKIADQVHEYLVLERLGLSLADELRKNQTITDVFEVAKQLTGVLEKIHNLGYVHRDIKPENILRPRKIRNSGPQKSTVFLADLGSLKAFRTGPNVASSYSSGLAGTARYASINSHLGMKLSPRDDLESLGYVIVLLLKGSLPWQGIEIQEKSERYQKIGQMKMETSPEQLCRGLPKEMVQYFQHCRSLSFDAKPDYNHIQHLFRFMAVEESRKKMRSPKN